MECETAEKDIFCVKLLQVCCTETWGWWVASIMAKWQTCAYGQINSAVCVWSQRFIWLQHDENDSKVKCCLFGTNSIQWTTLACLYSVFEEKLSWYLDCNIDILTLSRNRHLQLCRVVMVNSWYNLQIWCMDAQFEHGLCGKRQMKHFCHMDLHDTRRPFSYCFCHFNLKITYFGAVVQCHAVARQHAYPLQNLQCKYFDSSDNPRNGVEFRSRLKQTVASLLFPIHTSVFLLPGHTDLCPQISAISLVSH